MKKYFVGPYYFPKFLTYILSTSSTQINEAAKRHDRLTDSAGGNRKLGPQEVNWIFFKDMIRGSWINVPFALFIYVCTIPFIYFSWGRNEQS